VVLIKGPEAAAAYPDPLLRSFVDVDVLVDDVLAAGDALRGVGFEEGVDPPWAARHARRETVFDDKHHARPLQLPGVPLKLELHRRPSWPSWLKAPDGEPFLSVAVESSAGVPGVLALPPAYHAVVLAAHSWVDVPLGRLRDLVDVSAVSARADPDEVESVARALGVLRLWRATIDTADALLADEARPTLAMRTFARNLGDVRERTVFEGHVENWVSPFWTLALVPAARLALANLAWTFRPAAGEPWRAKFSRTVRAARHAGRPKSAHDGTLGPEARQFQPRKRWLAHIRRQD